MARILHELGNLALIVLGVLCAGMGLHGFLLEVGKVKAIVRQTDAAAFLTYHPLAHVEGGVVKKTGVHI